MCEVLWLEKMEPSTLPSISELSIIYAVCLYIEDMLQFDFIAIDVRRLE